MFNSQQYFKLYTRKYIPNIVNRYPNIFEASNGDVFCLQKILMECKIFKPILELEADSSSDDRISFDRIESFSNWREFFFQKVRFIRKTLLIGATLVSQSFVKSKNKFGQLDRMSVGVGGQVKLVLKGVRKTHAPARPVLPDIVSHRSTAY